MFKQKEIRDLVISILLLGLMFGFDDGQKTFQISNWILNFIRVILLVGIAVLFRELVIKIYAKKRAATSEYKLWLIQRVWFTGKKLKPGIPFGQLFAILGMLISRGQFFFTAIGIHELNEIKSARVGRKNILLTYYEEGLIVLVGIFGNLFLIFLSKFLENVFSINLNAFITINFFLILWNLILPVSHLDGAKVFFGSKLWWIFAVIFCIFSFIVVKASIVLAIIGGLIAALSCVFFYYKKAGA